MEFKIREVVAQAIGHGCTNEKFEKVTSTLRSFFSNADYVKLDKSKASNPALLQAIRLWADIFNTMADNPDDKKDAADYWDLQFAAHIDAVWTAAALATTPVMFNMQNAMLLRDSFPVPNKAATQVDSPNYYLSKNGLGEQQIITAIASSKKWYNLYNIIQLFFLTLLLALAGYRAYGQQFAGTMDQLITIFLVSFAMDITVANVAVMKGSTY